MYNVSHIGTAGARLTKIAEATKCMRPDDLVVIDKVLNQDIQRVGMLSLRGQCTILNLRLLKTIATGRIKLCLN